MMVLQYLEYGLNHEYCKIIELKDNEININSQKVNINGISFSEHKHNFNDSSTSTPIGGI